MLWTLLWSKGEGEAQLAPLKTERRGNLGLQALEDVGEMDPLVTPVNSEEDPCLEKEIVQTGTDPRVATLMKTWMSPVLQVRNECDDADH